MYTVSMISMHVLVLALVKTVSLCLEKKNFFSGSAGMVVDRYETVVI